MINIKKLSLSFGSQTIFNSISCAISADARIGLVGRNGSGKSTLLKIIAGYQSADAGNIHLLPGKKLAYMPQDVVLQSEKSILEETLTATGELAALQAELNQLQSEIDEGNTDEPIITRYVELHDRLSFFEPEKMRIEAETILKGLGFKPEQLAMPVQALSVGWKMRIVLAKLLMQKADFYLFDEPTNHLDIVAKDWFISFLKQAPFGFMLVCHERYFLDTLCTRILALEHGNAKIYNGNYSAYEEQYAADLAQLEAAYAQQQRDLKRKQETIDRFRAKSSKAKMAQSMQKQLDTVERITLPPSMKDVHFTFPPVKRAGRTVLELNHVAHAFGEKALFQEVALKVERGQRVALVAANGVGKTTLFNLIVGKLALQKGDITFGSNVDYAIFAQDQNEALHLNETILQNGHHFCPDRSEQQLRSFFGAFLFGAEEVKKRVGVLSGGEKNRVAMAIVLMQNANLLLLDEPTNHLDMQSKEILIKALKAFDGTIVFVSHDHHFINALATHVAELTPNGINRYEGNYDTYCYQKKAATSNKANTKQAPTKKEIAPKQQSYEERKQLNKLERAIERAEHDIKKIEQSFATLTYGTDTYQQAEQKLHTKKEQLQELFSQWEEMEKSMH